MMFSSTDGGGGYADMRARERRKKGLSNSVAVARVPFSDDVKLLTDRNQYLSYLESQLDRVNATVMVVDTFSERIEEAEGRVNQAHDRIMNLRNAVKIAQNFSEQLETDVRAQFQRYQSAQSRADERIEDVERSVKGVSEDVRSLQQRVDRENEILKEETWRRSSQATNDAKTELEESIRHLDSKWEARFSRLEESAREERRAAAETIEGLRAAMREEILSQREMIDSLARSLAAEKERRETLEQRALKSFDGLKEALDGEVHERNYALDDLQKHLEGIVNDATNHRSETESSLEEFRRKMQTLYSSLEEKAEHQNDRTLEQVNSLYSQQDERTKKLFSQIDELQRKGETEKKRMDSKVAKTTELYIAEVKKVHDDLDALEKRLTRAAQSAAAQRREEDAYIREYVNQLEERLSDRIAGLERDVVTTIETTHAAMDAKHESSLKETEGRIQRRVAKTLSQSHQALLSPMPQQPSSAAQDAFASLSIGKAFSPTQEIQLRTRLSPSQSRPTSNLSSPRVGFESLTERARGLESSAVKETEIRQKSRKNRIKELCRELADLEYAETLGNH